MEQAVISKEQKAAIGLIAGEPSLAHFYLTGGTALAAYYLKHRISDDLDFFAPVEADKIFLHAFAERIAKEINAVSVRFERLYDRNQFFFTFDGRELKIEFTKYPFRQLAPPMTKDGIRIDSLRDIAANKIMALVDRFDPKDFVDLFFLLQERRLEDVRKDAEAKFGVKIGDMFLGGELVKVRGIAALPKMLQPITIDELKTFFAERAKELAPGIFKD